MKEKATDLYRYQGPIFAKDKKTGKLRVISNNFIKFTISSTVVIPP